MDRSIEFTQLTTKFLFLNYNDDQNRSNKSELNILLNDLISIDYNGKEKFVDGKTAVRLLESFVHIDPAEETLVVKACCLLTVLLNNQKIQHFTLEQFRKIVSWQQRCLDKNFSATASDVLNALNAMFRTHPHFVNEYIETILSTEGLLMKYLCAKWRKNTDKYDSNSSEEIIISIIHCIDSLLGPLLDGYLNNSVEISDTHKVLISLIAPQILQVFYSDLFEFTNSVRHLNLLITSLGLLYKFATIIQEWVDSNIGDLLGIAKAFIHQGLPGLPQIKPQKVHISQQSVLDPQDTVTTSNSSVGGKVAKTRKPRTVNKNARKSDARRKKNISEDNAETTGTIPQLPGTHLKIDFEIPSLFMASKTSDSDLSESEASRTKNERHKHAKIRLAAISLIGLLAKNSEKRIFYGFWHSLFPTSDAVAQTNSGILSCVTKDPNLRCRIAALQTASVMLFGSRPFLLQAESSEKVPTTFMPFSISLGQMIITMYKELTQALATESSLPVLTQILKCLTVLIQATPFHRLKADFVGNFVKYIRRLVYHKDSTVQVAALMVMEFLISTPEMTPEISQLVEIPKPLTTHLSAIRNQNKLNDSGVEEVIEADHFEETIESDEEECKPTERQQSATATDSPIPSPVVNKLKDVSSNKAEPMMFKMSWLLQRVLENLGVIVIELKENLPIATTPVRIECLQVLTSMATHFLLLKNHLQVVTAALKNSLNDSQLDVRLYTAKCLDSLGHAMNTFLLENGSPKNEDILSCQNFWTSILPSVVEKIQDPEQSATLKSVLCDFMSNIGVHIYERLTHDCQIKLISLLSGESCNEENTVRAAAVRALAVYALFPSLRENLVFVENTAMAIIDLIRDPNLYVRVKASWSMGNVSDALITNCFNSRLDRISENLLQQMLEMAIESASDNDKIRCNAVRTLGNLLRLITVDHLRIVSWRSLSLQAIKKLVNCMNSGGNAKVKWNSCYAIGNFMKNSALFTASATDDSNDFNWQSLVFPALCKLIVNHSNFKVRINGTAALITIQERSHYGIHLQLVWSSILSAMEQSDNLVDFNEYKHRDNLQEQLCAAISHVIRISGYEDFPMLKNELVPKLETIKQTWLRVVNRVLPENAAPLLACSILMQEKLIRKGDNEPTSEQRNAIQVLAACFAPPSEELF